ncbi:TPA: hypothetical protein DD449_02460 [Candidatus Berkelbacteria bacterium]|uniref:Lipoprotein n=1 Tax=Berkelbacteria bacterium GW2011_GWE1_39_12 TaxID=1618337 RepID=A0A0G4B1W8_9BACT|nr:MAG: hypothetical protein UT28_C0001G0136 [Berkelbacteria bacterium GW2011_GWE1_39_12]HBO60519.1 hypothetical protein [Candidatus Berkelbacteria bacterium]
MEPQEKKHVSHWIAWSVIALLVGIVAFGCWYFNDQISTIYDNTPLSSAKKTTKTTATPVETTTTPTVVASSPTTTTVVDWKTYNNSAYDFTMMFNDTWEGFKAVSKKDTSDPLAYDSIYFSMPTTDSSWSESGPAELDDFATPFIISVYTLANWDKMIEESQGGATPTEITRDDKYVFAYSGWQACPTDLCDKNFDVKGIIETFKLN